MISKSDKDHLLDFGKNGIISLSILSMVHPVKEEDNGFIDSYIANGEEQERPVLQTPSNAGGHKHRGLRDLFAGATHGEKDNLAVAKEVKELEGREAD